MTARLVITPAVLATVEDVEFLVTNGCTNPGVIATRIGLDHNTITTYLRRAGRRDLALAMKRRES